MVPLEKRKPRSIKKSVHVFMNVLIRYSLETFSSGILIFNGKSMLKRVHLLRALYAIIYSHKKATCNVLRCFSFDTTSEMPLTFYHVDMLEKRLEFSML